MSERRIMLRFKILASAIPLILIAAFARGGLLPGSHLCIATADTHDRDSPTCPGVPIFMSRSPTTTAAATVRVQISDSAEAADFVVVDDAEIAERAPARPTPRHALWRSPNMPLATRP